MTRKTYEERKETFEEKKIDKEYRYSEAARKAHERSTSLYKESRDMVSGIPFGQPILVGHHSERAHRNLLDRSWNKLGNSVAEDKKANYYERKAENAVSDGAGIKTEDPDAIAKLKRKLVGMEECQELMKAANKIVKSKNFSDEEKVEQLTALGIPKAASLLKPDFCGRVGFASYALQNNNANMRRVKQRIEDLEAREEMDNAEATYGNVTVTVDYDDNRVRVEFPGKPSADVRKRLKSDGFRWSPRNMAWQAYIKEYTIQAAHRIAKEEGGTAA